MKAKQCETVSLLKSSEEMVSTYGNIGIMRGEQNPEELWETTLNPETRTLVQLTTKNIEETLELFDILMGNDSNKRKEYIMENAKEMI